MFDHVVETIGVVDFSEAVSIFPGFVNLFTHIRSAINFSLVILYFEKEKISRVITLILNLEKFPIEWVVKFIFDFMIFE